MSDPILEVSGLTVAYGPHLAVKNVSAAVFPDEIYAVVGPNGAGKTTLLECIAGLLSARAGTIRFKGTRVDHSSIFRRRKLGIVLVPQEGNVFPGMTVKENLEMGGAVRRGKSRAARVGYAYELFPRLQERERQTAHTLSGGERRMLAVGIGIVSDAELFLIDEPSVGLAPKLVTSLLQRLRQLRDDTKRPIVLCEQNIKVLNVADRILGMEAGESRFCEDLEAVDRAKVKELYLGLHA
jgi:branched-chain amino acid transport system ATP-binding protein